MSQENTLHYSKKWFNKLKEFQNENNTLNTHCFESSLNPSNTSSYGFYYFKCMNCNLIIVVNYNSYYNYKDSCYYNYKDSWKNILTCTECIIKNIIE